jgi:predicted adenylyl cyclase CyaB
MINETEIKLYLGETSIEDFINMCHKHYPQLIKSNSFQRDEYYDTSDMQLQSSDFVMRIRKKNDMKMVALKSPRVYLSEFVHKRIELEFQINDGDNSIDKQIEEQNLIPIAIIEKRRTTLKGDNFVIEVDEVPFLGNFVEIESSNFDAINKVCSVLCIDKLKKVKENYGELLDTKLIELGLPLRPHLEATFIKEIEYYK